MTESVSPSSAEPNSFWRKYSLALGMILVISSLHYLTPHGGGHVHDGSTPWYANLHGIYRRLYYFPIILAAFRGGRRGGELSALLVVIMYIPHATGRIGHDPGTPVEKFMEMALYLGVGVVTGILVERANAARSRLQESAVNLRAALHEKTVMEAELVRTARLAAVGRLSAGLAHEIRNPLASIQGSAEVLGDDFPEGHPKAKLLRIMLDETSRLNGVLSRFLDFARSEPGELESFDLVEEAHAVQQLIAMQAGGSPIEVVGAVRLIAHGNREQIRQVILNLAINATQATGASGISQIELFDEADSAVCWVKDSGPGFTAEAIEYFGTPFFSTKTGGTGLGLATSLRIVEDLGGSLQIDQSHHAGGCVKLTLPHSPAS